MAANRERRSGAGRRTFDTSVIDRLAAVRAGTTSRANQLELHDNGDVYEEMSEEQYQAYVKKRKEEEGNFVENDVGDMLEEDDEWGTDEEKKQRAISRVNMQRRSGGRPGTLIEGNDQVSSILLGAGGRQIRPGMLMGPGGVKLSEDEEDILKSMTESLDADDKDKTDQETRAAKRRKLMEAAMFGQESTVQAELESMMEEDEAAMNIIGAPGGRGSADAALKRALFEGSSAIKAKEVAKGLKNSAFSKPAPRLAFDDDGNLIDGDISSGGNGFEMDDDLIGDYDGASSRGFGIGDNLPDRSDPTFSHGGGGGGTKRTATGSAKKALPPQIKEISFASSEAGADWFKLSADGIPQMKMERGNVITATPNDKTKGSSPMYQVKVERIATEEESKSEEVPVTHETYNEVTMFWYDAREERGDIYLFGKALLPDKKSTTSCCIKVSNIERNLFVLPRAYKLADEDDENSTTDEPVQVVDIHSEIKELLASQRITKFKAKMVKREYCFDRKVPDADQLAKAGVQSSLIDADEGVPRDASYMKVVYGFDQPSLERTTRGKTFSRIFGTKSTGLELFLLKRNLMGPCWITIKHVEPAPVKPAFSWCKYNFTCASPKNVNVFEDCPDAPLFSTLSFSMRTVLNEHTQRHEIVMISYMYHEGVSIEGPTVNQTEVSAGTIVAPLPSHCLPKAGQVGLSTNDLTIVAKPFDLDKKVAAINQLTSNTQKKGSAVIPQRQIITAANETGLLVAFLNKLSSLDPDVLVNHDLHGFTVDVLTARMTNAKLFETWSRIGRLKQTKPPKSSGRGDDTFSIVDRGVGSGRLMLDTLVCSKEFLIGQKDYSLSYLSETQLKVKRDEIESSMIPHIYKTSDSLLELIKQTENDAFLQLRLMFTVVMLPLSKQLTCLCGNMWSRSLRAARAERVEFLLLHDFHRNKFLIPEKYTHQERKQAELDKEEEEKKKYGDKRQLKAGKNKPQYAGGLVLEPKRGFYDKYVLLLDFNSLYPSIIQEFNICFTTVKHWQITKPGEMAIPPPPGSETGHLPKVIKRLVERRRNVKMMLKKETNQSKRTELDIRQKALKLVANSMYGCLGFTSSRFYCEPLAALITSQGRDILQSSVELTNSLNANVIYGDTDSIMVYSNETDLGKCMELGRRIRTEINKRHQVLEIDIDGVFKNMLLLKKKKYAALKIVEQPGGTMVAQREVKGIDAVRRDWCPLSREIGFTILNEILSDSPREEIVEKIHAHCMKLRDDIKNNVISLDKFIITKSLTKNPKEYTDSKNQPHVKVALDNIARGKNQKSGDIVHYVICKNDSSDNNLAARAYDPQHVVNAGGALELDIKWYLSVQILPPIARLIGPIEETDSAKIAYALGLDPKAFHNFGSKEEKPNQDEDDEQLSMMNTSQDDEEKYKSAKPLMIQCAHCKETYQFPGVYHKFDAQPQTVGAANAAAAKEEKMDTDGDASMSDSKPAAASSSAVGLGGLHVLSGLKCPNSIKTGCPGLLSASSQSEDTKAILTHFTNRLNSEIRRATQSYYTSHFKCNDSSCQYKTRDVCVKGQSCLNVVREGFRVEQCKGKLEREVSATDLYLQLQYFRSLFDVERSRELIGLENQRRKVDVRANLPQLNPILPGAHAVIYKQLHSHMMNILRQSAYYWLSPLTLTPWKLTAKR